MIINCALSRSELFSLLSRPSSTKCHIFCSPMKRSSFGVTLNFLKADREQRDSHLSSEVLGAASVQVIQNTRGKGPLRSSSSVMSRGSVSLEKEGNYESDLESHLIRILGTSWARPSVRVCIIFWFRRQSVVFLCFFCSSSEPSNCILITYLIRLIKIHFTTSQPKTGFEEASREGFWWLFCLPTFVSTFLKITFSGINFVVSLFYDYCPGFGVLRREGQPRTGIVGLVTDHTAGRRGQVLVWCQMP